MNTQFKQGHIPWNKNNKGIHLSIESEFKKGCKPHNKKLVGCITIRTDKNKTKRKWIKIEEPNKWIEYYRYVWLEAGRKFKKNYCIHHINKDSLDDRLENLMLVSRQEHPKLHKLD